jgi:hypothetical protein
MGITAFFLENRANLLAGVLALVLFAVGGFAITQQRGIVGVFLLLAGFGFLMFLEYRNIDQPE